MMPSMPCARDHIGGERRGRPPTGDQTVIWADELSAPAPINEVHVSRPGLLVVDVAAADDATALTFQQLLADRWATALALHATRDAGQPGVRLRCYLDLRQSPEDLSSLATTVHVPG
ncbi:hypothetical protein OK006_8405 [Actinobacteria bacterium OK006]|nr:hypothetical protein OK006_8405 [Actinobacteria bacterium OK006]